MKRTTVKISDELDAKVRAEAARRGVTVSEIVREALEDRLGRRGGALRPRTFAMGDSGDPDGASDIDRIVAEASEKKWARIAAERAEDDAASAAS